MKIIKDLTCEIPETNPHYFELDSYTNSDKEKVLMYGYNCLLNDDLFHQASDYPKKYYLNITMPTEFFGDQSIYADDKFDKIFTICPFSVQWLNEIKERNKYHFVWYPFNKKYEIRPRFKQFDVIYHGGIHSSFYVQMLRVLKKFNYRFSSLSYGINQLTTRCLGAATDLNLSHVNKLKLISSCKISVAFNLFPIRGESDIQNAKSKKEWWKNEAFKHMEKFGIVPQIKFRVFEAAFCKTLNLVRRDPWNVIERFFVPNEDFVYFNMTEDLEQKIIEILNNYSFYEKMIESAYNKVQNYSIRRLVQYIQKY